MYRKIGFNTAIQISGKTISIFLGFLTVFFLTRYLGVSGYGDFTLVFSYMSFFGAFSDFGLQLSMVRELTQNKDRNNEMLNTYLWIKVILTVISLSLALSLLAFFPYSNFLKIGIVIGAIAVGISSISSFGNTFFQVKLRLDLLTYVDLLTKLITVGLILIFITLKLNFYFIISTVLIGNLIGLFVVILLLLNKIKLSFIFNFPLAKDILRFSFAIGITSFLALMYFKLDTIMLSVMRNSVEVGIYTLSYKILENILMLWGFYMASVYPILSSKYIKDFKNFVNLFKISVVVVIIFSSILIVLGYFLAPTIVQLFAGNEFEKSIVSFRILIFSIPFIFMNNLIYSVLLISKKVKNIIVIMLLSIVLNFLINLVLIPKFTYIGASFSTVITEVVIFLFYVFLIKSVVFNKNK